jgi:hypothetical protein
MALTKKATYKSNDNLLFSIRIDARDLAVEGNVDPGGNPSLQIYNRRSSRKVGPKVRQLRLKRLLRAGDEANGIPDQFEYRYITILTKAAYDAFEGGANVTYGGKVYKIDGGLSEDFKVG